MPSAKLSLGSYVTLRKRADNTFRVLFEVPKRLRPSGWPPQYKLPRAGFRRADGEPVGNLNDAREVAAIQEDARALYAALKARMEGAKPAAPLVFRQGSVPWLIKEWGGERLLKAVMGDLDASAVAHEPGLCSETWRDLEPRTRLGYVRLLRAVFAWSITVGHIHVRAMEPKQVKQFLDVWKDKPGQAKNIRGVLSQLFAVALEEGELEASPLEKVRRRKRKRVKGGRKIAVERWSRDDVALYAKIAQTACVWRDGRAGRNPSVWAGGAIMIRLMYETAADSTDVTVWTKRDNLRTRILKRGEWVNCEPGTRGGVDGVEFARGKSGQKGETTWIPISADLASAIRANGSPYFVTDPFGRPYQAFTDDTRVRGHLTTLRENVLKDKGPYRVFDHLRHSAATEAEESGVETDKIRHLTKHKDSAMNKATYIRQSAAITLEIQRARGIVE